MNRRRAEIVRAAGWSALCAADIASLWIKTVKGVSGQASEIMCQIAVSIFAIAATFTFAIYHLAKAKHDISPG